MHALQTFFTEVWLPFVCVALIMALLQFGRRISLEGTAAMFIGPRSFQEIAGFSKEEQTRLFRDADREAFPRWRFYLPVLVYAAIFSSGIASTRQLSEMLALPDGAWVRAVVAGLLVATLAWVASRVEAHYIRPFLRSQIERRHHAA